MSTACLTNPQLSQITGYLRRDAEKLFDFHGSLHIVNISSNDRPYSSMYRLIVSSGNSEKKIYLKVPRDLSKGQFEDVKREFNTLSFFHEQYKRHHQLHVVRPIAYYEEPPCLITEMVEGEVLHNVIKESGKMFAARELYLSLTKYCEMCGKWLRIFQGMELPQGSMKFDLNDEIKFIMEQITRCVSQNLLTSLKGSDIIGYIESLKNSLQGIRFAISGVHSDFIPVNIIINHDGVTVLDFSDFKSGSGYRDAASFLFALDCYAQNPMYVKPRDQALKQAFLNGLGWHDNEDESPIFRLFQIREILGHLLQISSRYHQKFTDRLKLIRLKKFSEKRLVNILDSEK